MIHIGRSSKTKLFQVAVIAANGEELNTSEPLKTFKAAIENIASSIFSYKGITVMVQDDSKKKSVLLRVDTGRHVEIIDAEEIMSDNLVIKTPYIPGKSRTQSKKIAAKKK